MASGIIRTILILLTVMDMQLLEAKQYDYNTFKDLFSKTASIEQSLEQTIKRVKAPYGVFADYFFSYESHELLISTGTVPVEMATGAAIIKTPIYDFAFRTTELTQENVPNRQTARKWAFDEFYMGFSYESDFVDFKIGAVTMSTPPTTTIDGVTYLMASTDSEDEFFGKENTRYLGSLRIGSVEFGSSMMTDDNATLFEKDTDVKNGIKELVNAYIQMYIGSKTAEFIPQLSYFAADGRYEPQLYMKFQKSKSAPEHSLNIVGQSYENNDTLSLRKAIYTVGHPRYHWNFAVSYFDNEEYHDLFGIKAVFDYKFFELGFSYNYADSVEFMAVEGLSMHVKLTMPVWNNPKKEWI